MFSDAYDPFLESGYQSSEEDSDNEDEDNEGYEGVARKIDLAKSIQRNRPVQ